MSDASHLCAVVFSCILLLLESIIELGFISKVFMLGEKGYYITIFQNLNHIFNKNLVRFLVLI